MGSQGKAKGRTKDLNGSQEAKGLLLEINIYKKTRRISCQILYQDKDIISIKFQSLQVSIIASKLYRIVDLTSPGNPLRLTTGNQGSYKEKQKNWRQIKQRILVRTQYFPKNFKIQFEA